MLTVKFPYPFVVVHVADLRTICFSKGTLWIGIPVDVINSVCSVIVPK